MYVYGSVKTQIILIVLILASLPAFGLVSPMAGEIWYAASVLGALMLFGLAVFFFLFGVLPYWFKVQ